MIKEVLQRIYNGETLAEIAESLKMEVGALMGMVEHLVKMGYLEERKRTPEESIGCRTCPLYRVCSKKELRVYYLTDKGRKLIGVK